MEGSTPVFKPTCFPTKEQVYSGKPTNQPDQKYLSIY